MYVHTWGKGKNLHLSNSLLSTYPVSCGFLGSIEVEKLLFQQPEKLEDPGLVKLILNYRNDGGVDIVNVVSGRSIGFLKSAVPRNKRFRVGSQITVTLDEGSGIVEAYSNFYPNAKYGEVQIPHLEGPFFYIRVKNENFCIVDRLFDLGNERITVFRLENDLIVQKGVNICQLIMKLK